jgi:hypothetical protein
MTVAQASPFRKAAGRGSSPPCFRTTVRGFAATCSRASRSASPIAVAARPDFVAACSALLGVLVFDTLPGIGEVRDIMRRDSGEQEEAPMYPTIQAAVDALAGDARPLRTP